MSCDQFRTSTVSDHRRDISQQQPWMSWLTCHVSNLRCYILQRTPWHRLTTHDLLVA